MTPKHDDWTPEPALLAAYFDGELDGRADLELLRRLERWLEHHPEAREVLADYQRLAELWRDTRPVDPGAAAWSNLQARMPPVLPRRPPYARWAIALLSTAAGIALLVWIGTSPPPAPQAAIEPTPSGPPPEVFEVFAVATAAEVIILRVEVADTQSLVVGELPLRGPLELLGPGEAAVTRVLPDTRDQMLPHVRMEGPHRPLIWAKDEPDQTPP
jgi:hypothetical protein